MQVGRDSRCSWSVVETGNHSCRSPDQTDWQQRDGWYGVNGSSSGLTARVKALACSAEAKRFHPAKEPIGQISHNDTTQGGCGMRSLTSQVEPTFSQASPRTRALPRCPDEAKRRTGWQTVEWVTSIAPRYCSNRFIPLCDCCGHYISP